MLLGLISSNNYPLTVRPKNIQKLKLTANISLLTRPFQNLNTNLGYIVLHAYIGPKPLLTDL